MIKRESLCALIPTVLSATSTWEQLSEVSTPPEEKLPFAFCSAESFSTPRSIAAAAFLYGASAVIAIAVISASAAPSPSAQPPPSHSRESKRSTHWDFISLMP